MSLLGLPPASRRLWLPVVATVSLLLGTGAASYCAEMDESADGRGEVYTESIVSSGSSDDGETQAEDATDSKTALPDPNTGLTNNSSQRAAVIDPPSAEIPAGPVREDRFVSVFPTESKRPVLIPEPVSDHSANKSMSVVLTGSLVQVGALNPLKMDAEYNQLITLPEALEHALRHNLAMKISRESWNFQRYQFYATAGLLLPSNTLGYSLLHSHVYPTGTVSMTRSFNEAVSFPVFQGGYIVQSTLAQYYRSKGWQKAYDATVNDTLLSVYKSYTNVVLQRALLQIRSKSREVSELQLALNEKLYAAGAGTRYAVMQAKAQLDSDVQSLLEQQVECRKAALDLAFQLNLPMAINLIPAEGTVSEASLVNENESANSLIAKASLNRPELRQYELFRLAAARTAQATAAAFYPSVQFFIQFAHTSTSVAGPLIGLSGVANQNIAATQSSGVIPAASANALGQQASFSPTSSSTANTGANTGAATTVAGGGGSPTASIQSGGLVTSGGVAPTLVNASGSAFGFVNGTTVGAGVFPGLFNTVQAGFQLNWTLPYADVSTAASVAAARALARQALNQSNQQMILTSQQVREDIIEAATARRRIDVAAAEVISSKEAWRMAYVRLKAGVGTSLELVKAQRKYVEAQITQAQAIVKSSQSQAQLSHDVGTISVAALGGQSSSR